MHATRTLLEIGERFAALDRALEANDFEYTPELEAEQDSLLRYIAEDEPQHLDYAVNWLRKCELREAKLKAEADQYQAEANRFKAAAKSQGSVAKRQTKLLFAYLQRTGRTEAKTASGRRVKLERNGGVLPLMAVTPEGVEPVPLSEVIDTLDANAAPVECTKRVMTCELVREYLETGGVLPFAYLKERGLGLRIR